MWWSTTVWPGRLNSAASSFSALAPAVLRHRLILSPAAEIEGRQIETVIERLIEQVEAPR